MLIILVLNILLV